MGSKKKELVNQKEELRRQAALAAAEQCAALLKEQFGAQSVIPFGSVTGDTPWHAKSDLDLAVEGLSSAALWEAEKQLEALLPLWLELDLVPLEQAYPEVRADILGERTRPQDPRQALQRRLTDELTSLNKIVESLETALGRAGEEPDEFATRALSTYLDDFYKGCERICERVAVMLDGHLPQGDRWHQKLLGQMGETGGQDRPPLFGGQLLLELDEYRRFRHRVRHIYGYALDPHRVLNLAENVTPVFNRVQEAVVSFNRWLSQNDEVG
jgi:predicted nucleotidyltransferase